MNFLKCNQMFDRVRINSKKRKRKTPVKLENLWTLYLNSDPKDKTQLLKKIKRHQQKRVKLENENCLYAHPSHHIHRSNKEVTVETITEKKFKKVVSDDLSVTLDGPPNAEIIFSTHLLFQCPICLEDEKLIDVILQCGHCLCLSCHDILTMDNPYYQCPICRKKMLISDMEKGPTIHNNNN